PDLVKWQEQLGSEGLTIIEIDNGAIDPLDAVRAWAAKERAPFAVFYDPNGAMCERYEVRAYPSYYLIGRDGIVVWQDHGWGGDEGVAKIEQAIRDALRGS